MAPTLTNSAMGKTWPDDSAVDPRGPAPNASCRLGAGGGGHRGGCSRRGVVAGAVALVVAMALQVGVNYSNDYSDGIRGTDANRVGPARLVGSGAVAPALVKRAAFGAFAVAAVAGLGSGHRGGALADRGGAGLHRCRLVLHRG